MSMPAGEGAQSGATGTQSGTETGAAGTTGTTEAAGTGAQSGAETGTQGTQTETVSRADYEALQRRLQAADQNNSKTAGELKALRDAQLSAEEKTKQDLAEAQAKLAEREEQIKQEKINNAFLTDNTYSWHDSRAALRLADLSGVELKDTGQVTGLKDALKAVAEANPWMLKPKDGEGATGSGDGKESKTGGATGVAGAGAGSASGADRAGLEKKFPQLKGRVSS